MITKFLRAVWNVIKTPWVTALLIFLLLILFVWIAGPYIAIADNKILASVNARLIATVILAFCWGLYVVIQSSKSRKSAMANPEKAKEIEKKEIDKIKFREEVDHIKDRIKAAIKIVTKHNFYGSQSRSRYALPWYLLLGITNCGKTSFLLNSGLKFPLNEQADRYLYSLRSTERCEILYGNEAIFIDTPGSYCENFVDSEPHQLWKKFLLYVFKVRPARPLNGIIVCVSMRDLREASTTKREHLARTLRTRLSEALKQLHRHVPIYLVFTKCDAVPGFAHFFSHLQRHEREQVFGCLARGDSMELGTVRNELKELMQTLNSQIITKIHQERELLSRGEMFLFPQELALLCAKLEDFISEAFGPSRYHSPVIFRGFFFTCALSANDILTGEIPHGELQHQKRFQPSMGSEMAKGYFATDLLQKCIIPEARLANADKEGTWHINLHRYGIQAAAAALFLFLAGFLGVSFSNNYSNLEALNSDYATFANMQNSIQTPRNARDILPELAKIEGTTQIYMPDEDSRLTYGMWLYQGKEFYAATHAAYLGTLNSRFLPLIRETAAQKINASLNNISELKPALRAYLMLCQAKNIDVSFLGNWLDKQWSEQYLGQADVQSTMRHHMNYLLANGIVPVEPNMEVVANAHNALLKIPLAEQAYQQMKEDAEAGGKAPFTFRGAIGDSPFDGDTFQIPTLYTRFGYEEYLIKGCPDIIFSLTDDDWIFGSNPRVLSSFDASKIQKDVRGMYFRDYIQFWSQATNELHVRTPANLSETHKFVERMTGGISPAVLIIREIKNNMVFTIEHAVPGAIPSSLEGAVTDTAQRRATQAVSRIAGSQVGRAIVGTASQSLEEMRTRAAEETIKDAQVVTQYFAPLVGLLDDDGNSLRPLGAAHDALTNVGGYFAKLATSDNVEQSVLTALLDIANERDDTLRTLESAAGKLPPPVQAWYMAAVSGGLQRMLQIGSNSINNVYQEKVLGIYNQNIRENYPFNSTSDRDVNLDAFASFFKAGGTLDSFYTANMRPFITNSGEPRRIMGRSLPISRQAISQLQQVSQIQDAFFMSGQELGVSFLIEPYALDTNLKRINLISADKTVSYWHGPVAGSAFTWPASGGASSQSILETIDLNGITTRHTARGDWSLFRLFKGATIKRQSGNVCLIEVQQNGKWAQFLIQLRNKGNPFDPAVYSFSLPNSLL